MSEATIPADLIVILAIAVFVIYKYRQVLGHKTGHDVETPRERLNQRKEQAEERVVQLRQYQETEEGEENETLQAEPDTEFETLENEELRHTLKEMKQQDGSFMLDEFIKGAKGAFDMVIEAFNQSDRQTLKQLLSDELYAEFDRELKQYETKEQHSHTTLVSILSAKPVDATLKNNEATVTVRFLTEQIAVLKDKDGEILEGDVSHIDQVEDEWVFERNLRSRNPNWTITDM